MKHKLFRRLFCTILTVLLLLSNISPAFAVEQVGMQQSIDPLQQYLEECLTYYLLGQGLNPEDDSYSLSQGLPIENGNDSNKRIYYLFCDGICMGELIVTHDGTKYISSFMYGAFPAVTDAYATSKAVSLYNTEDGCLYLCTSSEITQLSGPQKADSSLAISDISLNAEFSPMVLNTTMLSLELPAQTYSSSSVENVRFNVPIVANAESPDTGEGLCWAACVASIGAYRKNITAPTALEMYNRVKNNISVNGYTYPVGTEDFVIPALGLFGLDCVYYPYGLKFSDILLFVNNDYPIYAGVHDSQERYYHAVVICGYQIFPGAHMLQMMDPNTSYYVCAYMDTDSLDFSYTTSDCTYSKWHRRINEELYYEDV